MTGLKWALMPLILATSLVSTLTLTGCSDKDKGDKTTTPAPKFTIEKWIEHQLAETITINDLDGNPLVGAKVLVGTGLNTPFTDNFFTADQNGQIDIPETWIGEQLVTIDAPGFLRATYTRQLPESKTFTLRPLEEQGHVELIGETTGFQISNGDGKIDFAFVMPALKRNDLFHFNVGVVISPEVDKITAVGQTIEIPSNVSLPKQRESYFLPITMEKPQYRMYFNSKGSKKVYTARGQFPFKQVVDALRNSANFVDLINAFNIQGGSLTDVALTADSNRVNLPVNTMIYNQKINIVSPPVATGEVAMAAALGSQGDYMFPTDVKYLTPGQLQPLNTIGGNSQVLTLLKRKSETNGGPGMDRLSAALAPLSEKSNSQLLPLMENPRVLSAYVVNVPKVNSVKGLPSIGTYASLAQVAVRKNKSGYSEEVLTQVWEVYSQDWLDQVEIPTWPQESVPAGKLRWSVALLAGLNSQKVDLGPTMMDSVTHVTNSSADF